MKCRCLKCNTVWESRKRNPKFCPYCKNPNWNKRSKKVNIIDRIIHS